MKKYEIYTNMSSVTSTTRQQAAAVPKSPAPNQAAAIPPMRARAPARGIWVASIMAGNVMTARVT